jgi:uncharacterized membrane protein (UPF0127 family)
MAKDIENNWAIMYENGMYVMKTKLFVVFLIIFIVTNVSAEQQYEKFGRGKVVFSQQTITIVVEVARTEMQRTIGLMFREYLAVHSGMLFIFEQETIQRVWMRYTLIPLDVVFISAQGKIVSMIKNLQPCKVEPCEIYQSTVAATYMLEVNAGMLDRKNIEIGQKLLFYL